MKRTTGFIDDFIAEIDSALRTLIPPKQRVGVRSSPACGTPEYPLSSSAKKHIAGLMRVNHAGEVCAQALYRGQALTTKSMKEQMLDAAAEEIDHLAWCEERLAELGSTPSLFNPLWYAGSLFLGILAGLAGDKVSLGFVAETEKQVSLHLQRHLVSLLEEDKKTKAILEQMQVDEEQHALLAIKAGAVELPTFIKQGMRLISQLMTKSSYYL